MARDNKHKIGINLNVNDNITTQLNKINANTRKVSGKLKQMDSGAVASLSAISARFAALGYSLYKIIGSVTSREKYSAALKTATSGDEEFAKSLDYIDKLSTTIPFKLDEIARSFVFLRKKGLDPLSSGLVKTLANASAALGIDLPQATNALGHVMLGEYSFLKDLGLFGQTVGSKGLDIVYYDRERNKHRVSFKDRSDSRLIVNHIQKLLDAKYGGAAENLANTWTGAFTRLSTIFSLFIANFAKSETLAKLLVVFNFILDILQALTGALDIFKALDFVVVGFINSAKEATSMLSSFFGKIGSIFSFEMPKHNLPVSDLKAVKDQAEIKVSFNNLPSGAVVETASNGLDINSEITRASYVLA